MNYAVAESFSDGNVYINNVSSILMKHLRCTYIFKGNVTEIRW